MHRRIRCSTSGDEVELTEKDNAVLLRVDTGRHGAAEVPMALEAAETLLADLSVMVDRIRAAKKVEADHVQ